MTRVGKLLDYMNDKNLEVFIINSPSNQFYLGFIDDPSITSINSIALYSDGKTAAVTSSLESNRAASIFTGELHVFSPYKYIDRYSRTHPAAINKLVGDLKSVGDSDVASTPVKADNVISKMRMVKDSIELKYIREAAKISSKVGELLEDMVVPGKSEYRLAVEIDHWLSELGSRGTSFETIVASGIHSSYAHHKPNDKKIRVGDSVICDFGAKINGYCADITRTVITGKSDKRYCEFSDILSEVQEGSAKLITSGEAYSRADGYVRDTLNKFNLACSYPHSLGHGLGIDVHEAPSINTESSDKAAEGHVFTVEPGIYVKDFGGMRIEDDYWLSEDGLIKLTTGQPVIKI